MRRQIPEETDPRGQISSRDYLIPVVHPQQQLLQLAAAAVAVAVAAAAAV